MTAALSVVGLDAGYGGVTVVRGLELEVNGGEIVAMLGSNGAGKTTSLLTISGLLRPLNGEIHLDGAPVHALAPSALARAGVGHVSEDRALFTRLTTRQNLRLGQRGRRPPEWLLTYFPELEGLLDRRVGLLSGGEQQMLALARALVGEPRILLVDEMSLGLAPAVAHRLAWVLRDLTVARGLGILLVEQHADLALSVADRAYVLRHGEVVLEGPASAIRDDDRLAHSYLGPGIQ